MASVRRPGSGKMASILFAAWVALKKKKNPSRLGDCCSTAASSHPLSPPRTLVLPLLVFRPVVLPGCLLSPTSLPDSGCQLSLSSTSATSAARRNIHPEHHSSTQAPLPTHLPFPLLSTATTWPFLTSWLHCPPTFIPSFHFVSSRPSRPFPSISHHGFSFIHCGFPLHGFPPIMASPSSVSPPPPWFILHGFPRRLLSNGFSHLYPIPLRHLILHHSYSSSVSS